MAINVLHNVPSLTAQNSLNKTQRGVNSTLGRLATGLRIVNASDDAAGLAISENLRSQIRSTSMARRNALDGVSMLQSAEGALNEVSGMLMRMRELGVQSANGSMGTDDRELLANEFNALRDEIDRLATVTDFNGTALLDAAATVSLQVGIHSGSDYSLSVDFESAHTSALAASGGLSTATISSSSGAQASLAVIDEAIDKVSEIRGGFGAIQNRLTVAMDTLAVAEENLTAAESRVRDADIASESANMTRGQILMQAGVSVLAQANQLPSIAMSLIG